MKVEYSRKIFEKYSNLKYHEIRSMVPSCSMRTEGRAGRQTDVTKLRVAFRNFSNAPEMYELASPPLSICLSVHKNSNVAEGSFLKSDIM